MSLMVKGQLDSLSKHLPFQMLAECLTECHQNSVKAGKPLKLRVFVSGRNRLENPGATALAGVFKVIKQCSFF